MIDPITKYLLEDYELDNVLEGYDLKCQECGRVIKMVKDSSGPLECCNRRMFVMGTQAEPEDVEGEQMGEAENLKKRGEIERKEKMRSLMFPKGKLSLAGTGKAVRTTKQLDRVAKNWRESEDVAPMKEALVSADPTDKERQEFEEGLRKILSGETVAPDFQVPIKNVDFSPDNQADAQKKQEEEWDKEKKVKESAFIKDITEDYKFAKKK